MGILKLIPNNSTKCTAPRRSQHIPYLGFIGNFHDHKANDGCVVNMWGLEETVVGSFLFFHPFKGALRTGLRSPGLHDKPLSIEICAGHLPSAQHFS